MCLWEKEGEKAEETWKERTWIGTPVLIGNSAYSVENNKADRIIVIHARINRWNLHKFSWGYFGRDVLDYLVSRDILEKSREHDSTRWEISSHSPPPSLLPLSKERALSSLISNAIRIVKEKYTMIRTSSVYTFCPWIFLRDPYTSPFVNLFSFFFSFYMWQLENWRFTILVNI